MAGTNGLASRQVHLDKARSGASPLRERFMPATATSLRSPPHPLQMCRSNLSITSLHLVGRVARSWSSHTRALVMRFLIFLSVPEGWWSGRCGVPALHLKRGERGGVPASRSSRGIVRKITKRTRWIGKTASFGKWALFVKHHKQNILSSLLPRRSKRQRLQELLLALKSRLARPSPQPLIWAAF